ncbi:type-2 histone deacetylase 1-like [Oppia nitens]|uniref:type-2 histone deacetylase 1-like n=1 Tax=Oppia nitens TaxID=1686743 RepID=UPI0023DC1648|nr:type-2 histone deacetylase 1-like [Oppia nitens]
MFNKLSTILLLFIIIITANRWPLPGISVAAAATTTEVTICDFNRYSDGCEDTYGSECNRSTNQCQCRPGFTIKIDQTFCLPPKNLSESCFVSEQCIKAADRNHNDNNPVANIGCYVDDREIDVKTLRLWITQLDSVYKIVGTCQCPATHYLLDTTSSMIVGHQTTTGQQCLPKRDINENCTESQECLSVHSYCDQSLRQCRCKPTYRFSQRKRRCVAQLIGENCSDNDHCSVHDPNAECRIGSCQCRPGYILSHTGKCVVIRLRGTSNHLLMMLVVVATAVVFALLSTAHRKWSSTDDLFRNGGAVHLRNQLPMNTNWITRRTFPTAHNMVFPNQQIANSPTAVGSIAGQQQQRYPTTAVQLTTPSLALIWPLRHHQQHHSHSTAAAVDGNHVYPYHYHHNHHQQHEDGPPSYDEAIGNQSSLSFPSDLNNSITVITTTTTALNNSQLSSANTTGAVNCNSNNNNNLNNIAATVANNDNSFVNNCNNNCRQNNLDNSESAT